MVVCLFITTITEIQWNVAFLLLIVAIVVIDKLMNTWLSEQAGRV